VVAFRQLTLSVRHQEILCIVGPSGCGKTTFLRAPSRAWIDLKSPGDLLVGGKPVRGPAGRRRHGVPDFGLLRPGRPCSEMPASGEDRGRALPP